MTSLSITSLLAALDSTAVSTAMPTIDRELGPTFAYVWINNAYILTLTAFQPLFGQTSNIFGRRIPIVVAVLLFAVGSAICGPAPSIAVLIVGRTIQGIGGAGVTTMVEMVVCDLLPLRERGKFMGFIFSIYGIGIAVGPVIGGVLADRASWRWIFYLNLIVAAISAVLLALSLRVLRTKETSKNALKRIDYSGNTLLVAAITSMLLALTWGGSQEPWSSWRTLLPLILGFAGLVGYLLFETKVPEPTTPLRLFSNRTSLAGFLLSFTHQTLTFWIIFLFPIYFQAIFQATPTVSGVDFLPTAVVSMPFAIISGAGLSKWGRYRPWHFAGFVLFAISMGLNTMLNENSTRAFWAGTQIIGAVAIGVLTTITLPTIQAGLPESDVAVATATWGFIRGFGNIWGVAIPSAIFNTRVNSLLGRLDDDNTRRLLSNGGAYALASGTFIPSLDPAQRAIVKGIYVNSLKLCWQVALGFALLGFLIAFIPKEIPLRNELETEYGFNEGARQIDEEVAKPLDSEGKKPTDQSV
ncbi:hypothetical protein ABKA04_005769 [Annulohypoxylon sp. FPYF3050]